jgi:hypothetical protein
MGKTIIGIYKILSPSGRVYIGKSKNVRDRWRAYQTLKCEGQQKVFNSLNRYQPERHIFSILQEFTPDVTPLELAEAEVKWYDKFVTEIGKDKMLNVHRPKLPDEKYIPRSNQVPTRKPKPRVSKISQKERDSFLIPVPRFSFKFFW